MHDLEGLGAVAAFQRVRDAGFNPSRNLLYALQGVLRDVHRAELREELQARLRAALQ